MFSTASHRQPFETPTRGCEVLTNMASHDSCLSIACFCAADKGILFCRRITDAASAAVQMRRARQCRCGERGSAAFLWLPDWCLATPDLTGS